MAYDLISVREAIACAACAVAGHEQPLSSETPKQDRVFLYACPESEGGKFMADDLASRLDQSGLAHGVDWDRDSETFGLRFVIRRDSLPPEIKPFASAEAEKRWQDWKRDQEKMSLAVIEAAGLSAQGKMIEFGEDLAHGTRSRGRHRSRDERN